MGQSETVCSGEIILSEPIPNTTEDQCEKVSLCLPAIPECFSQVILTVPENPPQ